MTLDGFTIEELTSMMLETSDAAKAAYDTSIRLTKTMSAEAWGSKRYTELEGARDIAKAVGDELTELGLAIGAEMQARDYRDAPDGH